jgi:hypothetical protein
MTSSLKGAQSAPLLCPSAQPEMAGSRILGVVGGKPGAPELAYLTAPLPVTPELLALSGPAKPTEVFRFAAHCEEHACRHFDGTHCQLATRIVQMLPAVSRALPACLIRPTCRWYHQEGKAACFRCPQIITETCAASDEWIRAAGYDPGSPGE